MASFKETQMFKINKQVFDYLFELVKMLNNDIVLVKEENMFGYSKSTCCRIMTNSLKYKKEILDEWISSIMETNALKHARKEIDGNQWLLLYKQIQETYKLLKWLKDVDLSNLICVFNDDYLEFVVLPRHFIL
uniref:Uncharacterized protein n=1 Tax=viral metagenome TaxID=1070528 RepID=A0A6C0ESY1_9ZZZZ